MRFEAYPQMGEDKRQVNSAVPRLFDGTGIRLPRCEVGEYHDHRIEPNRVNRCYIRIRRVQNDGQVE